MNIIITNIGRRGYLAEHLKRIKNTKVFVSDCDITASGLYGKNDGFFILPKPSDNEKIYIEELLKCCLENEISVVIPVIDPEIYILSAYIEKFRKNGIIIIVSERNVIEKCYNKLLMNNFLAMNNFFYPKTFENLEKFKIEFNNGKISFPVIVKPIYGSGSNETFIVDSMNKLSVLFHEGLIIQEFLQGDEYGVDIFNTFEKKTVRCVIKKKISMRSGETDKCVTIKNKKIQSVALRIANNLGHIANLDCDMILSNDKIYIIDLNPRFGGGYLATYASGVNLLKLLIQMISKKNIRENFNDYKENVLVMKTIGVRTVNYTNTPPLIL